MGQVAAYKLNFIPNRTSFTIMQLVHGYFSATGKHWNLMSQQWILEHLEKWYGHKISRSCLNYNLSILREQGIIQTVTRHRRDEATGEFICQVTLYKCTVRLKKFFSKLASYFKRAKWVPDIKALGRGYQPVVGSATTPEQANAAYLAELRRRRKQT